VNAALAGALRLEESPVSENRARAFPSHVGIEGEGHAARVSHHL